MAPEEDNMYRERLNTVLCHFCRPLVRTVSKLFSIGNQHPPVPPPPSAASAEAGQAISGPEGSINCIHNFASVSLTDMTSAADRA